MSDILAGGAIDPTTSGPVPTVEDNRSTDIIAEQSFRQEQNAIGGSQQPPRIEPPPEPQVQEVAPPLPFIPNMGDVTPLVLAQTEALVRNVVIDTIKNIDINGSYPNISGSSISFDLETRRSASELFATQNPAATTTPLSIEPQPIPTPQQGSRLDAPDFGSARRDTPQRESRLDAPDFGTMGDPNFLQPEYGGGLSSDSKFAYQAAEARREARQQAEMDPTSDVRQKHETVAEYEERMEGMAKAKATDVGAKFAERIKDGIVLASGLIPVAFKRADNQKKILAYIDTSFVGVVEGATGIERTTELPPEDEYYEAGGGSLPAHPWQIRIRAIEDTDPPEYEYQIEFVSTVYSGIGSWSNITVNGLDTWTPIGEDKYIILEGNVDSNLNVTSLTVIEETDRGERITIEGENQTKFRVEIGYLYFFEDALLIRQLQFQHFTLANFCWNGNAVVYPIPT